MRHQAISVLLYEGIMAGTFDFDYSPKSENIQGCLLYINVSQEGEDALADLQALGMTCTLLLSTHQHNVRPGVEKESPSPACIPPP